MYAFILIDNEEKMPNNLNNNNNTSDTSGDGSIEQYKYEIIIK